MSNKQKEQEMNKISMESYNEWCSTRNLNEFSEKESRNMLDYMIEEVNDIIAEDNDVEFFSLLESTVADLEITEDFMGAFIDQHTADYGGIMSQEEARMALRDEVAYQWVH